ncbi:DNA mismatch repair protein MutS [Aquibium sp. A9E412]|uniref:DNA mismatch repair protein MutS n=1 Tax=Aquibium sp. A9E412 TaxID=2976767 RepID=UPI0025AEFDB6|nr:DNA mismatch repair protein MutS [Aquibium sp. A9E412]MDN2565299.1 DNA mismatch repair protein MutS [Aquibium sp. A9E412]
MMEQYIEIKAANPDSLLFYRMGDFYELFFEDAEVASRALGITLTKRGKHQGDDIPMCGVPVHAADDYLQKLIGLGHRVAVCEQTEDPAEAKKRGAKAVVRRDVVRLVTPGTITEDKLLAPAEANYLMALGRVKGAGEALALAWIDISTGAFRVASSAPDRLLADILRVDPRELVVAEPVFHDAALRPVFDVLGRTVNPQPASLFDSAAAEDRVARFFGVATLDGFGSFGRAELSAIAGAIAYVEKTQKAERPPLGRPERDDAGASLFIDAATRANLELMRTLSGDREGSLFKAVDRTVTGPGARLLAERLTAPLTDAAAVNRRLDAVGHLLVEPELRAALRTELKGVPDMARALSRLALNRGGPRDLAALAAGLAAAGRLAALLDGAAPLPDELAAARRALDGLPAALADHLARALADDVPLMKRDGGFVRPGYDGELDEMRALRDESRRVIAAMERELAEETGIRSLKIRHNNVLGYFIEVTANHRETMTGSEAARARFIHRQTMASALRFTTTELADLQGRIANAAERAVSIELAAFDRLVAECVGEAEALRAGAHALAVIDVAAALAALAEAERYCRPEVDDSLDFRVEGGRHPVVEQALRRQLAQPFVANDCDLSPASDGRHGAIWLLTGPNMGGKSTFLRQNALIAILAQTGSFVPARAARIGVVDRLFSRVGASDDLARGRSTFMVEMVETAAILNQAGERALVILDEIGRGTATFDGLSIAWAAVEYLHAENRCRAIFATHFHELTALADRLERLHNATMRVKEWEGEVVFLHEVGRGAADRSYGVQVARLAGLPPAVVERARAVLQKLEAGETSAGKASRLADELPLFAAPVRQAIAPARTPDPLAEAVAALTPDEMTPREALEALYRLKGLVGRR